MVLRQATRTAASGSSRSEATSSMKAAPRTPIFGTAAIAARRTLRSWSNIARTISTVYIWPSSPHARMALMACILTLGTMSLMDLMMSSMYVDASSFILLRLSSAAARTAGCFSLMQPATFSAAEDDTILVNSATFPRDLHAASTTSGCGSSRHMISWSSNLAPSASILPSARTHSTLISKSCELMPFATLLACFLPLGPIIGSAAAAAHAGLRAAGGAFFSTPAADSISVEASSVVSRRSGTSASTSESAFSPMPPRAAAAKVFVPTFSLARSFPMAGAREAAFSPRAATMVLAAIWTSPSGSASSLGTWPMCFSAAAALLPRASAAAARARPSLCARSFATAASSASMSPRPAHAATTMSTSLLSSFDFSLPAASVAFMAPKDAHASTARSRSLPSTTSTRVGTCATAPWPNPPKARIAAFFTSLSLLDLIFAATSPA
mmetsp:Transcript_73124/g.206817  ORF Transcript_73124/g.206817 Transcript_73124/m.206817 type:complete len:440 (+) Transcript_73124:274-1593(+)